MSVLKTCVLAAGLSLAALVATAQTMREVVSKPEAPLTFMGLDFSAAKYIGDPGTVGPEEMKGLFTKIDGLLVQEARKYDFAGALRKNKVDYNIGIAESANAKIDPGTIITPSFPKPGRIDANEVQAMVRRYAYPAGVTGTGLVLIMEDLNKATEKETMWVTFVDLDSKKVLHTEKLEGTGAGFGFRNHWAGGIYDVIKEIKSKKYGEWKKKFAKS